MGFKSPKVRFAACRDLVGSFLKGYWLHEGVDSSVKNLSHLNLKRLSSDVQALERTVTDVLWAPRRIVDEHARQMGATDHINRAILQTTVSGIPPLFGALEAEFGILAFM